MRRISLCSGIIACLIVTMVSPGCTKETIVQKVEVDISKTFSKKWSLKYHEFETYSSGSMISKTLEDFSTSGYYLDFRPDSTYEFHDLNGNSSGKWHLISDNNYVIDPGTVEERYYFILSLSDKNLIVRGPFTSVNTPESSGLYTTYYQNP